MEIAALDAHDDASDTPVRYQYIGQTGTTLHRRQKSHQTSKSSVLKKHIAEYHPNSNSAFHMKPVKSARTILERLVWEGNLILQTDTAA